MKHIDYYFRAPVKIASVKNGKRVYKTLCSRYVKPDKIDNKNSDCTRCKEILAQSK